MCERSVRVIHPFGDELILTHELIAALADLYETGPGLVRQRSYGGAIQRLPAEGRRHHSL